MTGWTRVAVPALVALTLAGCARPGTQPGQAASRDADGVVRTAGCATATSPPATSIDGTPQPANQGALDDLANRIQPYAEDHYATVYTGLELRSEQSRLRVYRKPSADFDAWVTREFAAACVEVVDARFSAQELHAMIDRISADMPYWQAKGVQITTLSANVDGSGIEVGTTDVERARTELPQRYGSDIPFSVVEANPVAA